MLEHVGGHPGADSELRQAEAPVGRILLGVGERQLRRLFQRKLGASPIAVAQTRRIHLAKQLIHETSLPMTEVALASGFGTADDVNLTLGSSGGYAALAPAVSGGASCPLTPNDTPLPPVP